MKSANADFYVWFDTEYSTLDLESARLLQVAALITDFDLRRVVPREKDISVAIRLAAGDDISPWVRENLPGLVRKCLSPEAVDLSTADDMLSAYVDSVLGGPADLENERPVLAGNSVHADWRLAQKYLPRFMSRLNYRHLDVTAFKLEWKRLNPGKDIGKDRKKFIRRYFPEAYLRKSGSHHDAYFDVQASIAELAFYRRNLFSK
jgi:oligoribonuclease